jgi:acylglycerol lipase
MSVHESSMFQSSGGVSLFEQYWLPGTEPRGVVAIVHGYAEHSGRYAHVAEFLADRGYAVEAFDLRGHGRSAGTRARVKSANEYLLDTGRFLYRVRERHLDRPIFLLGHSMGGLIATLYAITRKPSIDGLIVSGPAISASGAPLLMRLAVGVIAKVSPGFGMMALDANAISRDPQVVMDYVSDPLVFTGKMQAGLLAALMRAVARIDQDMEEIELPLLVMHGREDRLAPVAASELLYARASSTDKTLKVYDGLYHEIFNEPERETVLGDLASWLDAHTAIAGEAG